MEAKKKKELEKYPRITYSASNRKFERLLRESTLESVKNVVRQKLRLSENATVELTQRRNGDLLDLEDDDDFAALRSFAYSNGSVEVVVAYEPSTNETSHVPGLNSDMAIIKEQTPFKNKRKNDAVEDDEQGVQPAKKKKRSTGEEIKQDDSPKKKKEKLKSSTIGSSKEPEQNQPSSKRKRSKSVSLELNGSAAVSAAVDLGRSKSVAPESFKPSESSVPSSKGRSKSVATESEIPVNITASIPPKTKKKRSKSIGPELDGESVSRKRPKSRINGDDRNPVGDGHILDKWMSSKSKGKKAQTSAASEVEDDLVAGPSKILIPLQAPDAGEKSSENAVDAPPVSKKKKKKQVGGLAQIESPDVAGHITAEEPSRKKKKREDKMHDSLASSENQYLVPDQDGDVELGSEAVHNPSLVSSVEPVTSITPSVDGGLDITNHSGNTPARRKKKRKKSMRDSITNNGENISGLVLEKTYNQENDALEDTAELSSTLVEIDVRPKKKRKGSTGDSLAKTSAVATLATSTAETSSEGIIPSSSRGDNTSSSAVEKNTVGDDALSLKLDPSEILSQFYAKKQQKSLSKRSNASKPKRRQVLATDAQVGSSSKDDSGHSSAISESLPAKSSSTYGNEAPEDLLPISTEDEIALNDSVNTTPVETVLNAVSTLEPDLTETDANQSSSEKSNESSDEEEALGPVTNVEVGNVEYNQMSEAEKILLKIQKSSRLRTADILASIEKEEANEKEEVSEEDEALLEEEEDEEEEHERSRPRLQAGIPIMSYGENSAFLQDESSSEEDFPMIKSFGDIVPLEQTPPPESSPGKEAGLPFLSPVHTEASSHSHILLFKDVNERGESVLDSHRGDDAVEEAMEEDNAVIKAALEELEQEYERVNSQKRKLTPSESDDITRVSDSDGFDLGKEGTADAVSPTVPQSKENAMPQEVEKIDSHTVAEPTGVADIINPPVESDAPISQQSNTHDSDQNSQVSKEDETISHVNRPSPDLPQSNDEPGQLDQNPLLLNDQAEIVDPVPTTPSRISSAGMIRRMKDRFGHSPWKSGNSLSEEEDSNLNDHQTSEVEINVTPALAHTFEEPSDLQSKGVLSSPIKITNSRARVTRASARRSQSVTTADGTATGSQVQEKATRKPPVTRSRKKAAALTDPQDEQPQSQSQSLRRSGRLREKPVVLVPEGLERPPTSEPEGEHQSLMNGDAKSSPVAPKGLPGVGQATPDLVDNGPSKMSTDNSVSTNENSGVNDVPTATSQEKDSLSTQAVSALYPSQIPSSFILRPAYPVAGSVSVAVPSAPLQNHVREPSPTESSSSEDEAQNADAIIRPSIHPIQMSQSQSQYSFPFFQTLTDLSKRSDLFLTTKSSSPSLKSAPIKSLKKKSLQNDDDYDESSSSSSESDGDTKKISIIPPERRAGNNITTSTPRTPTRKFSISFISTK